VGESVASAVFVGESVASAVFVGETAVGEAVMVAPASSERVAKGVIAVGWEAVAVASG
jgi:hypothetical protein